MFHTFLTFGALILVVHAEADLTWLGTLETLSHGVNGEVYAEDDHTILIKSFVFDGESDDTFFALSKTDKLEEPLEFLADEVGSRQQLATYMNEDIRLRLNPNTQISDYKTFGIYNAKSQNSFGQVVFNKFPKPFVRSMFSLGHLTNGLHHVSGEVLAIDERTLLLKGFNYDGMSEDGQFVLFKNVNNINGSLELLNDEDGSNSPLVQYRDMDVILTLRPATKLSQYKGLAIYCGKYNVNFGSVVFPQRMRLPRGARKTTQPVFLGPLVNNSHNVGGNVFRIDEQTILITRFTYDGLSPDGQFVLSSRSEIQEPLDIIGDERGNRGPLRKYDNQDIFINLNQGSTLNDYQGLSIYCAKYKLDFGHVFFSSASQSSPAPSLPLMSAKANIVSSTRLGVFRTISHNVSGEVFALDDTTLYIKNFVYDGTSADGKFVLSRNGKIEEPLEVLADEWGTSNDGLLEYTGKNIIIRLNPGTKLSDFKALGVYCADYKLDFGHVIFGSDISGLSESKEDPNTFNSGTMW
jgi:hypothetical protein